MGPVAFDRNITVRAGGGVDPCLLRCVGVVTALRLVITPCGLRRGDEATQRKVSALLGVANST